MKTKEFNRDNVCEAVMDMSDVMDMLDKEFWRLHKEVGGEFKNTHERLEVMTRQARVTDAMEAVGKARAALQSVNHKPWKK